MTRRRLLWRGVEEWLAEECEVTLEGDRLRAVGVQLGAEPEPYRADYELTTGADWVTERLLVGCDGRELDLRRARGRVLDRQRRAAAARRRARSTATWPSPR